MAFRFDLQPRWIVATSSLVDHDFMLMLKEVASDAAEICKRGYQHEKEVAYLDPLDRPLIILPPIGGNLKTRVNLRLS